MNKFIDNRSLFETSNLSLLRATLLHSLHTINKILPADGGHSIVIWNPKTETFDVGATTTPQQPEGAAESRVRRAGGATRWIIDHNKPLVVPDIRNDQFTANQMLYDYGNQAYIGIPLLINEKAIGVLYALSRQPREYPPQEITLLQDFSRFIAITIHNMLLKYELDHVHELVVQERNLLQLLIDATPVNIYFKDTNSLFVKINKSSINHYGVESVENIVGKSDFDFYPPDLASQFYEDEQLILESGQAILNKEEFNITQNGVERWVLTNKIPLRDFDNMTIGIVGVSQDITDRKRAEQERRQLGAERQRVTILQNFISDASHDFKTPLSTLKTQLFLLRNDLKDHPANNRVDIMTSQVDRISSLLDAMLYMTRLDAVDSLVLERVDLNSLLENMITDISDLSISEQLDLVFEPNNQVENIFGNVSELTFLFHELINNAIHNTPHNGHIHITIDKTTDDTIVTIADNGIGIEEKDLPRIFDRFYRLDEARGIVTGGAGLGLAIAKRIIELHSGSIQVKSIVGEGSKFTVLFPNARRPTDS